MITLPARKSRNGIGSNLTLTCEVSGDPLPNIIWTRDGATTNQLVNATGSVLNLVRIQLNDAGSYRCTADNGYGVVSSLASVNIICKLRKEIRYIYFLTMQRTIIVETVHRFHTNGA